MPFLVRGKARDKRYKPAAPPPAPVIAAPVISVPARVIEEPEVVAELISSPAVLPEHEETVTYPTLFEESEVVEKAAINTNVSEEIEPTVIALGGSKKKKKEKVYGRPNDE